MKNTTKTQINKILKSEIFSPFFGMFMLGLCYVCGFLFGGISVNELFTKLAAKPLDLATGSINKSHVPIFICHSFSN